MVEATIGTEATMTGEATGVVVVAVVPTRGLVEGDPIMAMEEVAVDTVEDVEEEGIMTEGTIVVEEEVLYWLWLLQKLLFQYGLVPSTPLRNRVGFQYSPLSCQA